MPGARAVFVRFAGCNLWSGREQDRATAVCRFCDTDFVGTDGAGRRQVRRCRGAGRRRSAGFWGAGAERPLRRADRRRADAAGRRRAGRCAARARVSTIAIESNGTLPAHPGIDWVCISPKAGSEVVQRSGDELKLVWPQPGSDVDAMEQWDFAHFLVQPMDDAAGARPITRPRSTSSMARPHWRLTLQTHKLLGLR